MNSSNQPYRTLPPILLLILFLLPQYAIGRISSNSLYIDSNNDKGRGASGRLLGSDDEYFVPAVPNLTDGSASKYYDGEKGGEQQPLSLEGDEMPRGKSLGDYELVSFSSAEAEKSQAETDNQQDITATIGKQPAAKPPVWPDDDDDDDDAAKKKALDNGIAFVRGNDKTAFEGGSSPGVGSEKESNEYESGMKVVNGEDTGGQGQMGGMEEGGADSALNEGVSGIGTDSFANPTISEQEQSMSSTFQEKFNTDTNTMGGEANSYGGNVVDDIDANQLGNIESSEKSNNLLPLEENIPTSTSAYHRNESNQEEVAAAGGNEGEAVQSAPETVNQVTNEETVVAASPENPIPAPEENAAIPNTQLCAPATNCIDCISLSFIHLRNNAEPCYWTNNQCLWAEETRNMDNPPSTAFKCAEDGSAIYTGDGWEAALKAVDAGQVPVGGEGSGVPESNPPMGNQGYDYYDEEDGLFEMVKSTFNVLLLAAFIASILVIRKRVTNRLRDDPSLETADVVKEEVVSCFVSIGSYVANAVGGSRDAGSNHEYRPITMSSRTNSFERQAIPLSTAADEEWGWGDEDTSTNVELPAVGGDDAKEEEDLALAIAMSLSESTNGGSAAVAPPKINNIPKPTPKPATVKPIAPSSFQPRIKGKKSPKSAPKPTVSAASVPPPPPTGDSIEDLLGQMSAGGTVITSFGQKPQNAIAQPKTAPPKKQDSSSDDIFASMGLSTYSSKPATSTAPKSAPLPSLALAADNDDGDADWGDDGDLDDLLDD